MRGGGGRKGSDGVGCCVVVGGGIGVGGDAVSGVGAGVDGVW